MQLTRRWDHWVAGGAICSEMESSTIFVLSSVYRARAGSVNTMVAKVSARLPYCRRVRTGARHPAGLSYTQLRHLPTILHSPHRCDCTPLRRSQDEHLPKDSAGMALFKGDRAIRIAVEALKLLIKQDKQQRATQKEPPEESVEEQDAYPAKRSRAK